MRTVRRNAQKMKYALYLGSVDVVSTDSNGNPHYHEDSEGNRIYIVTGEKRDIYDIPVEFDANFSTSGGEAQEQEYGLDISQFDAVLIYSLKAYPITEGTLIWKDSEVKYDGENMYFTNDMQTLIEVHSPVKTSADYVVKKVGDSLNYTRVNVSAINK